jgi:hypothetical protein
VGEVISALARSALHPAADSGRTRNGVPLLPRSKARKRPRPVTRELVRQLLDELP